MGTKCVHVKEWLKWTPDYIKENLNTDHHVLFEDNQVIELTANEITLLRFML